MNSYRVRYSCSFPFAPQKTYTVNVPVGAEAASALTGEGLWVSIRTDQALLAALLGDDYNQYVEKAHYPNHYSEDLQPLTSQFVIVNEDGSPAKVSKTARQNTENDLPVSILGEFEKSICFQTYN